MVSLFCCCCGSVVWCLHSSSTLVFFGANELQSTQQQLHPRACVWPIGLSKQMQLVQQQAGSDRKRHEEEMERVREATRGSLQGVCASRCCAVRIVSYVPCNVGKAAVHSMHQPKCTTIHVIHPPVYFHNRRCKTRSVSSNTLTRWRWSVWR